MTPKQKQEIRDNFLELFNSDNSPFISSFNNEICQEKVADFWLSIIEEEVRKAREEAIKECVECLPEEKTWPIWGKDTSPCEGDTTSRKDENKGFNLCRAQTLKCLSAKMQENGK